LSGSNSFYFSIGSDLSATATQLQYNYSGSDFGTFLFRTEDLGAVKFWCGVTASAAGVDCDAPGALAEEGLAVTAPTPPSLLESPRSGTQVIAGIGTSTGTPAATADAPEPGTLGLLVAGIALLGFRKFRWAEAASRD
jgi:hypothetical protein